MGNPDQLSNASVQCARWRERPGREAGVEVRPLPGHAEDLGLCPRLEPAVNRCCCQCLRRNQTCVLVCVWPEGSGTRNGAGSSCRFEIIQGGSLLPSYIDIMYRHRNDLSFNPPDGNNLHCQQVAGVQQR